MKIAIIGVGIIGSLLMLKLEEEGIETIGVSLKSRTPWIGLIQSLLMKFPEDIEMAYRSRRLYEKLSRELNQELLRNYSSITIVPNTKLNIIKNLMKTWSNYGIDVKLLNENPTSLIIRDHEHLVYSRNSDALVRIDKIVNYVWKHFKIIKKKASLTFHNGKVCVKVNNDTLNTDYVVLCAGAGNRKLLKQLGLELPLITYKCQSCILYGKRLITDHIIYDYSLKFYTRPLWYRLPYIVIAGNGNTPPLDPDENDLKIEDWFIKEIKEKISKRFRKIHYIYGRAGFCETTPDSKPLMGRVIHNLYIIGGFNGYGVEIGPGLIDEFTKILLGKSISSYGEKYLISRFSNRNVLTSKLPESEAHEL